MASTNENRIVVGLVAFENVEGVIEIVLVTLEILQHDVGAIWSANSSGPR